MSEYIPFKELHVNPDLVENEGKILLQFENDHDLQRFVETKSYRKLKSNYPIKEGQNWQDIDWNKNQLTLWFEVPGDW